MSRGRRRRPCRAQAAATTVSTIAQVPGALEGRRGGLVMPSSGIAPAATSRASAARMAGGADKGAGRGHQCVERRLGDQFRPCRTEAARDDSGPLPTSTSRSSGFDARGDGGRVSEHPDRRTSVDDHLVGAVLVGPTGRMQGRSRHFAVARRWVEELRFPTGFPFDRSARCGGSAVDETLRAVTTTRKVEGLAVLGHRLGRGELVQREASAGPCRAVADRRRDRGSRPPHRSDFEERVE